MILRGSTVYVSKQQIEMLVRNTVDAMLTDPAYRGIPRSKLTKEIRRVILAISEEERLRIQKEKTK